MPHTLDSIRFVALGYGKAYRGMTGLCISSLVRLGISPRQFTVFTDRAEELAALGVDARVLPAGAIGRWAGKYRYKHRAKIILMRQMKEEFPDVPLFFTDSDIFWRRLPAEIGALLSGEKVVMDDPIHFCETSVARYSDLTTECLGRGPRLGDGKPPAWKMYCSGAIGIPASATLADFDAMLKVCDHVLHGWPGRMEWAEQVAFSAILQDRYPIYMLQGEALHYWHCNSELAKLGADWTFAEWRSLDEAGLKGKLDDSLALQKTWRNKLSMRVKSWKKSYVKRRNTVIKLLSKEP